jgi:hypothetical protein
LKAGREYSPYAETEKILAVRASRFYRFLSLSTSFISQGGNQTFLELDNLSSLAAITAK